MKKVYALIVILDLETYPKEEIQANLSTKMFTTTLFIIVNVQNYVNSDRRAEKQFTVEHSYMEYGAVVKSCYRTLNDVEKRL